MDRRLAGVIITAIALLYVMRPWLAVLYFVVGMTIILLEYFFIAKYHFEILLLSLSVYKIYFHDTANRILYVFV